MNEHDTRHIRTAVEDGVLQIQLTRPEKRNALTLAMYEGLCKALEQAESDPKIRVVLLQGSGGSFTSGNDLNDFLAHLPGTELTAHPVFRFLFALARAPKPLIAAVEGPAVGIGTTLLLHCDLIYAAPETLFQLPFVNLGLCPEAASSLLLPRRLGHARAAEVLLLGEAFTVAEAKAWGLINAIVPHEQLAAEAQKRARQLAQQPAAAVRLTKALLKRADTAIIQDSIATEGRHFVERLQSPEAKEALQAFFERRKPDFSRFQ